MTEPISCPVTPLPKQIGPYKILKKIASGGMGEVFLAHDPFCKRQVALKKIRSDRIDDAGCKERFLKEVKIAARLSHPAIIPIYQMHQNQEEIYYTMPLVEGETLKEILRKTHFLEKQGGPLHPIGSSIPSLMRIFFTICQAIAYAHSKEILHRDLKPENIIVGKYGEVLILDWGLADFAKNCQNEAPLEEESIETEHPSLTRPGKIAGTLSYLPPERILGVKASYSTDIYALGVILYQLLTLRLPFRPTSIRQYKKLMKHSQLIDPAEKAPHRDIPIQLSKIAKKCLSSHFETRYASIAEILIDLENYLEGRAEWSPCGSIQIDQKSDWAFQENVLLAKQVALTQKSDVMEWVSLMMARQSFQGNVKFETHIRLKEQGSGVGFLFTTSSTEGKKEFFQEGFFLWIGSEENPGSFLFRSNVEVMATPNFSLKKQMSHFLTIEKTENHLRFTLDHVLVFDYLSHIPLNTPRFGVISKDDELEIGSILISSSSPNIMVNCLAVPDAFFALRHFKQALIEYRQISRSFLGRPEGREAIFRAGITLLEEAQEKTKAKEKEELLEQALQEFGELKNTPGAPLEYLGKSLVYKASGELEEEMKCLELSLCKFAIHPLIHHIKDQILFRLHEAAYKDRKAAYHLALLTLRYMPEAFAKTDNHILLHNLKAHCKHLPFLYSSSLFIDQQIAFYLHKPQILQELFHKALSTEEKMSALFCLLHMGHVDTLLEACKEIQDPVFDLSLKTLTSFYQTDLIQTLNSHVSSPEILSAPGMKSTLTLLLDPWQKISPSMQKKVLEKLEEMQKWPLSFEESLFLQKLSIEWFLHMEEYSQAFSYLEKISTKELDSPSFSFFKACQIASKQGMEAALSHLSHHFEPIDNYLFGSEEKKKKLLEDMFTWEKIQLFKQLHLFYQSAKMEKEAQYFQKKLSQELLHGKSSDPYS